MASLARPHILLRAARCPVQGQAERQYIDLTLRRVSLSAAIGSPAGARRGRKWSAEAEMANACIYAGTSMIVLIIGLVFGLFFGNIVGIWTISRLDRRGLIICSSALVAAVWLTAGMANCRALGVIGQ